MSDDITKRLDAIEQKAFDDFDAAVPDASRFGRAGAGIIARQATAYVREVVKPWVEEVFTLRAKLIESEERRVRARQEADAALKRERQNGDILLKVAGAFNGWANGKRGASGASEALEQIGEALGVPFAEEAAR